MKVARIKKGIMFLVNFNCSKINKNPFRHTLTEGIFAHLTKQRAKLIINLTYQYDVKNVKVGQNIKKTGIFDPGLSIY